MKHFLLFIAVFLSSNTFAASDEAPFSIRMATSQMQRFPEAWRMENPKGLRWNYTYGLVLHSLLDVHDRYTRPDMFDYALDYADTCVQEDGSIINYKVTAYSLDRVLPGRILYRIYEQTKNPKYKKAMDRIRSQFDSNPRNPDGGFWHRPNYPHQMWLDGLYMAQPFMAEYCLRHNRVNDYQIPIHQLRLVGKHTYEPEMDLFKHGYDDSKTEAWADPITGRSKHCWGRAMGWYAMAVVDVLEFTPIHEPGRNELVQLLQQLANQMKRHQDKKTGVWYQVIDRSGEKGNYLESSCSSMFTYTLLKGVRLGYLDRSYLKTAKKAYKGLLKQFIRTDANGSLSITNCCAVAGLGGEKVYRSGTFEYYISEPVIDNDLKSVGSFIKASLEMELIR